MDTISIRYGESLTLPIDTGDITATEADIFIGRAGEVYVLTKNITLTAGVGTFEFSSVDTQIPLGVYSYQINVTDGLGNIKKTPSPDNRCGIEEDNFPSFIVKEALDVTEVS